MIGRNSLRFAGRAIAAYSMQNPPESYHVPDRRCVRRFVNINTEETLRRILGLCRDRNYPYLVLGNGSNILAADSGYAGVILHLGKDFPGFSRTAIRCTVRQGQRWDASADMLWSSP